VLLYDQYQPYFFFLIKLTSLNFLNYLKFNFVKIKQFLLKLQIILQLFLIIFKISCPAMIRT
jgi:hypothetical protein